MRTPLVIGNWKMHGTVADARALTASVRDELRRVRGADVVLCPPFTVLGVVGELLAGSPIALGAQTCHWQMAGAFTGEISPTMLVDLGCRYVLVGHSERRRELGETDEQVNRKLHGALAAGLLPVLCVGETAEERQQGLTFRILEGQLRAGLRGLDARAIESCVLAYEPVWAIGTGLNATAAQAAEVHGYLRRLVAETSAEVAPRVRILYGGSVKPENAAALTAEPDIDGALVGGASLTAPGFASIVRKAAHRGVVVLRGN
jgi:triosephosphate isomerase